MTTWLGLAQRGLSAGAVLRRLNRRTLAEQLLMVSGANRDVLRDAPRERTKQIAMGAVLVSTASIAALSASYAFRVALHLWVPVAVLGGLAWGFVILNLDRWLVVSTPRLTTRWGTVAMALPRVVLAVLIGAVISTPLTLAVFSAEITAETKVMAAEANDDFTRQLAADSRYAQLPAERQQIAALQAALAAGVTDDDVTKDPTVAALQQQVDDVSEQYDAAAAAVVAESDGSGGTGVPGHGVQYFDKVAERDRLQRERDALQQQLDATRREVRQQLDATYAKTSADDRTQLATLQGRVDQAQHSLDSELAAHQQDVAQSDGILNRLTALGRIQHRSPMLATAHWLLFLFMTALECLPIIFKTMLALAPPSLYERLVALEEEKAEQRVRLRMQTEYEEAETLARSALAAAEARAASTLAAEATATEMVLQAQLEVTQDAVQQWRDGRLATTTTAEGDGAATADAGHVTRS